MSKVDKKQVVTAALVGGIIFCLIVIGIDYLLGRDFSWSRLTFYFIFATIMYGYLTYRNFKKHKK
ncbi:hypothetical protein [uncultured Psychroserpens sp.]|uniref:hypothetical protein n=1 Tax=uncultured Psychroserpens sp. TaxID=255436 RepID=UPI002607094A|nr:hypothetical protein [uncultured Psychroserpens sp.]